MSLSNALNSAISGLKAQSAYLSAVSENLANSNTTAYKTREVTFGSLIYNASSSSSSGGVHYSMGQNVSYQGLVSNTGVNTNVAIQGGGFFVVSDNLNNQPSAYNYSRNGSFTTDQNGFLINSEGYYLLGQATDADGNVLAVNKNDLNSLNPIDVSSIAGTARATQNVKFEMNLPAEAAVGDTFTTAAEVFDSLGVSHTVEQIWEKVATNQWEVTYSNPIMTGTTNASGTITGTTTFTIDFDGNGALVGTTPNPMELNFAWTTGANPSTVAINIGDPGMRNGLTQSASNYDQPDIELKLIDNDGVRYGAFSSVEINNQGLIIALFDNGLRQPIYQIPIATFPNEDGLRHVKGSIYDENQTAGNYSLKLPGEAGAGNIIAESLESSGTDTSTEFNKMIIAQQAYSASSQIVKTVDQMFQTLIQAVN